MKYGYIDGKKYEVESARLHKRVVLMKFVGVDDRNAAELLVKKDLQVPREDLVPLAERPALHLRHPRLGRIRPSGP